MSQIIVHAPAGFLGAHEHDTMLDSFLRELGDRVCGEGEWGEKYGSDFKNNVFMMHAYCWCGKDDCPWCWNYDDLGIPPTYLIRSHGMAPPHHGAPNFWHKPTDFKVWWYKYIGRGMEVNQDITVEALAAIASDCFSSLRKEQ